VYAVLDEAEQLLAETMASYWTNFARSSDPNGNGGVGASRTPLTIHWPVYTADGEVSITLDVGVLSVEGNRNGAQCDFIDSIGVPNANHSVASREV
jgi:carboxylesterase type B